MAVCIRMTRMGSKKNPHYRIVAADSRAPRDGRHLEILGYHNPQTEPATTRVDEERLNYWLARGAKPSRTVENIISGLGLLKK